MLDRYQHLGGNPVRNAVVIVLFGAITIVFIFWGLIPKHEGSFASGGSIAEVNGELVSIAEFENERERLNQMYSSFLSQLGNSDAQRQMLARQALNDLLQIELISQEATRQGLYVVPNEIRDTIVNVPAFQKDGRFQKAYYEAYLRNIRSRPAEFEKRLRKESQFRRTAQLIEGALSPLGPEEKLAQQLSATRVNLNYLKLTREELAGRLKPASSAVASFAADAKNQPSLQEYYNAHLSDFTQATAAKPKETSPPKDAAVPVIRPLEQVRDEVAAKVLALQTADRLLSTLEERVRAEDVAGVEKWLGENKAKWSESGEFSLADSRVPGLGEAPDFMRAAFQLSSQKPLHNGVIREGNSIYLLKLKSRRAQESPKQSEKSKSPESQIQATLARRGQESIGRYLETLRASASIHENKQVLGH